MHDCGTERLGARCLRDDPGLVCLQIPRGLLDSPRHFRPVASSNCDLDRDAGRSRVEHEVDFRSDGRTPEIEQGVRVVDGFPTDEIFEDEGFPAQSTDGVLVQLGKRVDIQEMM